MNAAADFAPVGIECRNEIQTVELKFLISGKSRRQISRPDYDGVSLCVPAQKMFYCGDERGNGITFFRLSDNAGNRQIFAHLDRFQIEFLRDNRARNEFIAFALSVLDDVQVKR